MKTLNIFACGGAGQNITADLIQTHISIDDRTLADLNIVLVDTSESNYEKNKKIFDSCGVSLVTIPGLDGSGQIRRANVNSILPHIGKIINDHAAVDASLNIVICSLSGGSGSVIGSLLAKELLLENRNVIVMAVGDDTTRMFADNTLKSIQSLQAISKQTNVPVVAHYFQNSANRMMSNSINGMISGLVLDYRLLFGGCIHGVDSSDLHNFLNYQKVTSVTPSLTLIDSIAIPAISESSKLREELNNRHGDDWYAISMINIQTNKESKLQDIQCEYRIDGEIEFDSKKEAKDKVNNLYFVLTDSYFANQALVLEAKVKEYDKRGNARVEKQIKVEDVDESGLVL